MFPQSQHDTLGMDITDKVRMTSVNLTCIIYDNEIFSSIEFITIQGYNFSECSVYLVEHGLVCTYCMIENIGVEL